MLESVSFLITSAILTGDSFSCFESIALKRQPKPEIQQKKSFQCMVTSYDLVLIVSYWKCYNDLSTLHVIMIGPVHDNDYFHR